MEDYLQTEWPELSVWLTSTTEQWAVLAVQGPKAREVLAGLTDVDLSAAALPHMGMATGRICGVPLRLFRVSFTGELGFEINVPADYGAAVWQAVEAAGAAHGLTVYGTETMHVLRAEKGYIIVGQDTDGTVTPDDAGLSWAIGKNKPDFVGKRSLERAALRASGRRQLVGLASEDPQLVLEEGAQVMAADSAGVRSATSPPPITAPRWAVRLPWRSSPAAARAWARRCTCRCRAGAPLPRCARRCSTIRRELRLHA